MRIRQSDLASAQRCFQQKHLDDLAAEGGLRADTLSATVFGSVIHHAVHVMESLHHQGRADACEVAVATFEYYWHPDHIDVIEPGGIDIWLPRQTYGGLLIRGRANLRDYYQLLKADDGKLLALEYQWEVPWHSEGTTHTLTGTVDRLALRINKRKPYLSIEDFKTGKKPTYLRYNVQWSMYAYASTHPEFWQGFVDAGEWDPLVQQMAARNVDLLTIPRRGRWIHLDTASVSISDAGWRVDADYARLQVALREYVRANEAGIFPLTLAGDVCMFCFSGDTRYWTAEGVKTFAETVGTTQRVLVNTGGGGTWRDAAVRHYGRDRLDEVILRRGRSCKVVRATPSHRWLVLVRADETRTASRVVTTSQLRPGDRLASITPIRSAKVDLSPIGIMAGIVFGDGNEPAGRNACVLTLYGEKQELVKYFDGCARTDGADTIHVHSLPRFMKRAPDVEESRSYLLGWLAGYVATDGSTSNGQVILSSSRREHVELARTVAARVGIATGPLRQSTRDHVVGGRLYPDYTMWSIQLRSDDLPEGFLLRSAHRANALRASRSLSWTVVEVRPGDVDDVFCVEVPEHENFALDDWINVRNCGHARNGNCGGVSIPEPDDEP